MKKIAIIIACICCIWQLQSCKKYHGDTYDFSNTTPNYIKFVDKSDVALNEGDTITETLQTRVAFAENVTYAYSVVFDQGPTLNFTGTYPAGGVSKVFNITFPVGTVPAGADSLIGEIKLVSAAGAKQGALAIGYPVQNNETIPIILYK